MICCCGGARINAFGGDGGGQFALSNIDKF
jgi:hypothetical protein